jgi:ABC-type nitrate/sulfonate/bicarbonate transport system permease component
MTASHARTLRVVVAVLVLAAAWQVSALMVQSSGGPATRLAPTWQQIFLVDLPGMASFQYGGQESDYGAALWVLATNAWATILRVLTSLLLAFVLGTALGVITMSSRFTYGVISPIARVVRNVPLLALVPLFLIWFGGEEYGVIAFITFGLSVIYLTSTIAAIETVDRNRVNFARVLGANRLAVIWDVILPSIVPNLLDATRVAVGVAFAVGLGGEFLAAQDGLGRLLIVSETYVQTGRMVIILLCYVVLASVAARIVDLIGNRLTRWLPHSSQLELAMG